MESRTVGSGIMNTLINKLPVELHVPSYQYCGPGTKLEKRLKRGDPGINKLDQACKVHDIPYAKHKDLENRHKADEKLEKAAEVRIKADDSNFGERVAARVVASAMKIKRKMGMGANKQKASKKRPTNKKKNRIDFKKDVLRVTRKAISKLPRNVKSNIKDSAKIALAAAKMAVKSIGDGKQIEAPRVIPLPKVGGLLPLIPIFAGLSALGALAGGAAGITKAVNQSKVARKNLEESQRHNKMMESIALGKSGDGLYLKQYKQGLGLYMKSKN